MRVTVVSEEDSKDTLTVEIQDSLLAQIDAFKAHKDTNSIEPISIPTSTADLQLMLDYLSACDLKRGTSLGLFDDPNEYDRNFAATKLDLEKSKNGVCLAHRLGCPLYVSLCAWFFAQSIKGRGPDEIRKMFNLPSSKDKSDFNIYL